jgi:hypothetical protein
VNILQYRWSGDDCQCWIWLPHPQDGSWRNMLLGVLLFVVAWVRVSFRTPYPYVPWSYFQNCTCEAFDPSGFVIIHPGTWLFVVSPVDHISERTPISPQHALQRRHRGHSPRRSLARDRRRRQDDGRASARCQRGNGRCIQRHSVCSTSTCTQSLEATATAPVVERAPGGWPVGVTGECVRTWDT